MQIALSQFNTLVSKNKKEGSLGEREREGRERKKKEGGVKCLPQRQAGRGKLETFVVGNVYG